MPTSNIPLSIDSKIALLEFSEDNGATFKALACFQGWTAPFSSTTNKLDTSCGSIVTGGSKTLNSTFSGTVLRNPTPGLEVSINDLLRWFNGGTQLVIRQQSPVAASYTAGATYYLAYGAIIADLTITDAINSPLAFSGTLNSTGDIDITP